MTAQSSEAPDLSRAMKELCEAVRRDKYFTHSTEVDEALSSYEWAMAALDRPKPLRTESERNAEIAGIVLDYYRHITRPGWKSEPDWDSFSVGQKNDLNRLCAEPTRPDPQPEPEDTHFFRGICKALRVAPARKDEPWPGSLDVIEMVRNLADPPPAEPECPDCADAKCPEHEYVVPPPAESRGLSEAEEALLRTLVTLSPVAGWCHGDEISVGVKSAGLLNTIVHERRGKTEPDPPNTCPTGDCFGGPLCRHVLGHPEKDPQRAALEAIRAEVDSMTWDTARNIDAILKGVGL